MTTSIIWQVTKTHKKASTRANQNTYIEVTLLDRTTGQRAQTLVSDTLRNQRQWQQVFDAVNQGSQVFIDNLKYKHNADGSVTRTSQGLPLIDADSKPNIQSVKGNSRITYNNLFE